MTMVVLNNPNRNFKPKIKTIKIEICCYNCGTTEFPSFNDIYNDGIFSVSSNILQRKKRLPFGSCRIIDITILFRVRNTI